MVLLIKLVLVAIEIVQASSYSDNDDIAKRIRGSCDLGNYSDLEPRTSFSSSGNPTPNPYANPKMMQPTSPMPNVTPLVKAPFSFSPYYREYLANFKSSAAGSNTDRLMKFDSNGVIDEAVDLDTSMRFMANLFSYKSPELSFAPTASEMMSNSAENDNELFKFDHGSNVAFIQCSKSKEGPQSSSSGSIGIVSGPSSLDTPSLILNDRDIHNLIDVSRVSLSDNFRAESSKSQERAYEPDDYEDQVDKKERVNENNLKPSARETPEFEHSSTLAYIYRATEAENERKRAAARTRHVLKKSSSGNASESKPEKKSENLQSRSKKPRQSSLFHDDMKREQDKIILNSPKEQPPLERRPIDSSGNYCPRDLFAADDALLKVPSPRRNSIVDDERSLQDIFVSESPSQATNPPQNPHLTDDSSFRSPNSPQSKKVAPVNSRRQIATAGDIFTALAPAVTIGTSGKHLTGVASCSQISSSSESTNHVITSVNLSNTLPPQHPNQAQSQMRSHKKESKKETAALGPNILDQKAVNKSPLLRDQQSIPVQPQPTLVQQSTLLPPPSHPTISPKLHTYFQWGNMFRLPTHAAPPFKMNQNRFQFARNEHTSKRFLKQLRYFRRDLKYYRRNKIPNVLFKDFEPLLNYYSGRPGDEVDTSNPKRSRKNSLTDSQPIKIFNSPPMRTWIPVRCDALGFDFKVVVDGNGVKTGAKAKVSIVYDANKEAREKNKDSGSGKKERVTYISKEYYDMEYFLNEYNFFQFAHLPYLPKPFCVEHGQYPKIVMEHVPGERVHYAFYRFGQFLRHTHPEDKKYREEEMKTKLIKVLAKILVTVKYIHSIGFIHADIKPENIIYDLDSGRVVIIDFDLSVAAPYVFTCRGTETTIAPELNGLLEGPVHYGIDWWAYGSTAAMIIAAGFAGILFDSVKEEANIELYFNYVPFKYIKGQNAYEMTPIPEFFPPAMRSFLYPFFNPDPSLRVFSEHNAYNWIRSHPIFSIVTDWDRYEKLDLGDYSIATPMHIGLIAFSRRPVLLMPIPTIYKYINGFTNMLNLGNIISDPSATTKDGTLASLADSGDEDDDEDEFENSDEEEEEYGGEGEEENEEEDNDDNEEEDNEMNSIGSSRSEPSVMFHCDD